MDSPKLRIRKKDSLESFEGFLYLNIRHVKLICQKMYTGFLILDLFTISKQIAKSHMLLKQKQWWNSQNKEKFAGISQYQNHKYFWTHRSCAHARAECRHKIMPNLSNILGGLSVAFYWLREWQFWTPKSVNAMNMLFAHLKPPLCNIYCVCLVSHGLILQIECTCNHGFEYSPLLSPPWIIVSPCVTFWES